MDYTMEDLLPIVKELAEKYTGRESSSVTYETARMLMDAVIYCVQENADQADGAAGVPAARSEIPARKAYETGCALVLEKARQAKAVYEEILEDYYDYGCRNYRDTVGKGMMQFFLRYDPRFCPQDHLLTLDYPAAGALGDARGVDLILKYLRAIRLEQKFLDAFERPAVESLLERLTPDYQNNYMDNIAQAVLLAAIGCGIAHKPVGLLKLDREDYDRIGYCLEGKSGVETEACIRTVMNHLLETFCPKEDTMKIYFSVCCPGFAIRIQHGLRHHALDKVLGGR